MKTVRTGNAVGYKLIMKIRSVIKVVLTAAYKKTKTACVIGHQYADKIRQNQLT